MKTAVKVSMKQKRELLQFFLGCQSRVSVTFCGIGSSLIFFLTGGRGTYQIENTMFPCISWGKSSLSLSLSLTFSLSFSVREKIPCFREKNTTFPDSTKKIISQLDPFWEDHLFRTFKENIIFSCIFFLERLSFIFLLRVRSYFRLKEISSFPIMQERSYSSAIFLERPCFQDVCKKKYTVENVVYTLNNIELCWWIWNCWDATNSLLFSLMLHKFVYEMNSTKILLLHWFHFLICILPIADLFVLVL